MYKLWILVCIIYLVKKIDNICFYNSIGRHSKSINVEHRRCGYCHGKFEILINKTNKDGSTKTVLVTSKRTPTAFALFVKENYAEVRTPQLTHGRVMKLLGEKFSEVKIASGTC